MPKPNLTRKEIITSIFAFLINFGHKIP